MEHPELPSLDELASAVPDGLPDNATFPITETPPPGYMTDENDPVSPSSSAGIAIKITFGLGIWDGSQNEATF